MRHQHQRPAAQLIYGLHPLEEALSSGASIEKIWMKKGLTGPLVKELTKQAHDAGVPVTFVPSEKLNRMTSKNHQGVIAALSPIRYVSTDDIVQYALSKGEFPLIVVCDKVTDVRNVGAIARTALGTGAHGLVTPQYETALITDDAVKASAGALLKLPVSREQSLERCVDFLKLNGIVTVAADAKGKTFSYEQDFNQPVAIVMGSEDEGVSEDVLKKMDAVVKLPMTQNAESYNVSVAAGMLLYEAMRQRTKNGN